MEPCYLGSDCQLSPGFCVTQPWMLLGNKGSQWASSSELQLCRKLGNYQHSVIPLLSFASTVPAGDVCMQYWCVRVCVCVPNRRASCFKFMQLWSHPRKLKHSHLCARMCFSVVTSVLICVVMKWSYQFLTFLNDTERNFLCDVPFSFFLHWWEMLIFGHCCFSAVIIS